MSTWEEQFRRRPVREPLLELIETCWRMRGPARRILSCGIFRTDAGIEVRCGYGEDLLRSHVVPSVESGRTLAAEWRDVALLNGGFTEVALHEG